MSDQGGYINPINIEQNNYKLPQIAGPYTSNMNSVPDLNTWAAWWEKEELKRFFFILPFLNRCNVNLM